MASDNTPKKIGRYQVVRELGRGGMGIVYLGKDPFIGRLVAVKTTLPPPFEDTQRLELFHQLFFNEARAAGKLTHPHIVSVYDATVEDDLCYLVMEYVDGSTLKELCSSDVLLPIEKAVKIIFQSAKALDYAHQNGVIHRDIKPSNIIISAKGEAKISDFGIATIEGAPTRDEGNSFTGSVYYTSPEQSRNDPLTPQTDLFSLGVVMYEVMTGKKPFEADTNLATIFKIAKEKPEPLKKFRPEIPESLERIVMKALEKDLSERYQTGMQLASDLSSSFDNLRFMEEEIKFEEKFNALKKIQFFKDFSSTELAEVLDATQWIRYEVDDAIITEGEIENCFYIIISGEVMVKKKGRLLAVLKQGDCFGEMAYIGHIKRTASIEALKATILMKVNTSVINQTSMRTQLCFYKVFSCSLVQRLSDTSRLISTGKPENP